jgi:hypothetical protein
VFTNDAKNLMLEALDETPATGIRFLSLHTAYSATGANEVTGGSPAYARKAAVWNAAASGQKALNAGVTFDVPAGTVAFVGFWTAVTAGTFLGMQPASAGAYRAATVDDAGTDVIDSPAHGYADTNQVLVWAVNAAGLPTGLSEGTIYYVRDATTDTFKLALTSGGSAIDITAVGKALVQRIITEVYAAQGTYAVSSATLDLTTVL